MNVLQHFYKTLPWAVQRCAVAFLLLVSCIAASQAQPIAFSNATVTVIRGTHNFQCGTDGFFSNPEPRWRVRVRPTSGAFGAYTTINGGGTNGCGTLNFNTQIANYTNICSPQIEVEIESWEDDGCGNDLTYSGSGCVNNDEAHFGPAPFQMNYQAFTQGANADITYNGVSGYSLTIRVNWTATTGGLSAPTAANATICSGTTALLAATNTPAAGNHFEWFADAGLITLLASGTTYTTPSLAAAATYYVAEVSGGNCHGPVTAVNVAVNAAPSASITGTSTICQNASTTLTANGGGTYSWSTLQTGSSITVSPASSQAYTVTVTAANTCTASSAVAVTVNPAPTTTPYTLCQNATVVGGLTSDLVGSQTLQSSFTGSTASGSAGTMLRPLSFAQGNSCGNSAVGTATPYTAQAFTVPTTGSYTFDNCSSSPAWDSYIILYQAPFNPTAGCAGNAAITAGDDNCGILSSVTATLTAGVSYVVVVAGFDNTDVGAYTLTASSPVLVGSLPSVEWYTASTGGLPIATGSPFNPVGVAGSGIANTGTAAPTTFYAQFPGGVCRTPAIFTINATPNTPTAANVTVCYNANAALSATSNIGTIEWYNVSSGGAPVSTGGVYNIPNVTANATYWAEAVQGTCRSPRQQVGITVTPTPATPITANTSICAGSSATLSATGTNVTWWNAATGGTQVGAGSPFPTATLNSTTDFFAQETIATCPSSRALATVVVNPIPASPIANGITICNNTNTTLNASGSNVAWYDAETGGVLLGSGNDYTTVDLTATTSFYPQQTVLGCTSTRTTVTVTVNPVPATPVASALAICEGSNGIFTATGSGTIQWYDMAVGGTLQGTGGTYNAGALLNPTLIYVQQSETTSGTTCVSVRVPVSIVINTIPMAPATTGTSVCENTSATVSAVGSNVAWFDAGGSPLGLGNALVINPLGATTTVYAQQTVSGCTSTRAAALATAKPIPAAPNVTSQTICDGDVSSLVASPDMSGTVNWYLGASLTNTGTVYNQASPAVGTYTYSVNENLNGCISQDATSTLTVNPLPSAPTVANATVCSGSGTTLTAIGAGTIEWYDAVAGGNLLQVGNTYNTIALTANMMYYVQQTVAGCVSPRGMVAVTVNAAPTPPIAPSIAICEGSTVMLTASGGTAYEWYADPAGLSLLASSALYTTPVLNSTTLYYVHSTSGTGCVSEFTPVTVTVNAMPSMPVSAPALSVCSGNTATITVSGSGTIGNSIRVYDGANMLLQGFGITNTMNSFVFTTPILTANATYHFGEEQGFGAISCESTRATVIVSVEALPLAPTAAAAAPICSGSMAMLSVLPSGNGIVHWYNAAGTMVGTGNSFTTPVLTANTTYTVREQSLNGCVGANTTVTVTVNNLPNQPTVQPNTVNVCRGFAATINIQNPNAANTYSWFTDAAATQPANPATGSVYTSNPLNNSTTIYVQTTNANGCKGQIRAVPITVAAAVTAPNVANVTVCSGATVSLSGTNTNNNTEWYNNPQGTGTPLFTGSPYLVGVVTANTTVFAQSVTGQGCKSTTTPVTINVTALPAAPVTASAIICSGNSTTLSATGTGTIMWYDATGTLQGVGATFNTPALTANTTYDVVASFNNCTGTSATATVTVNPIPAAPAATATPICRGSAATFTVTTAVVSATYTWFADAAGVTQLATGTTFTTQNLNNNTTYYLQHNASGCSSALVAVTAQVQPLPPTPSAAPVSACLGTTVDVNAINGNPTTEWRDALAGGNLLFTGNPFAANTSAVGSTTVFVSNLQGTCRSQATPVQITVNPTPALATITGNMNLCEGQTTTLIADGGGNTIIWLNVPGFDIATLGTNFTTPPLQVPGANFAVIAQDANNCTSFLPVQIMVSPAPLDAQATATPICAGQTATLNSTSGPGTTWYADATGSTVLGMGGNFTTNILQQNTTFYVALNSPPPFACRSNIKAITVVVNALPNAPSAVDKTICSGNSVTLTAINSVGTTNWYTNPAGTGTATPGTTFPTGLLNATTTYYLANTSNGCNSVLSPVTVTVTPKPATPTPLLQPDTDYCIGSTLVGFVQGTGGTINWNVQAFGGAININQVGEAFNLNTANLPVPPGTYPVVITQIQNGCVSDPLSYNVELHGAPVLNPFAATTPICEGGAINITGLAGNFDYLWTTPSGATFTTQDLAISNVNVNDHQGFYTYILIDKNFGCRSEIQSVYQEVNATPTGIVIQTNSPLCAGTTLSLNTPLIGNATYAWTGPSNFTSSTRNNTIPAVLANGTYDVVVTVEGCASVPASADVVVIAAPNANAGADATIQYGAVATLLATGGFVYNWSPAMLLNNSSTQSPTTISTLPVGSTSYTVTVADANGCTATDAVTIIVSAEPVANSIMNLITPNGDGMNDEWHVPFLENLDGYQLSIYARAGNLVYSSTNYDQKWAGTMDGAALPDGPYWFVIALKEGRVIKGAITVKR